MKTAIDRTRVLLLAAAIASMSWCADAATVAADTGSANELQEIIVTAQFRSQNLQTAPVSITAISADSLQTRGQTNVAQIANEAPNVTLESAPAENGPSLGAFIRGVGQSDFNPGESPGVGMYIDDVYYGTLLGSDFKLIDLDRVEILRGPQGTLAGQNSIGGSIKLFSKKPDGEDGGSVEATYGSYRQVGIRASGDATIIPEELFLRIAGVSEHQNGYVTRYDYGCSHPGSGVASGVTGSNCIDGTEGGKAYDGGRVSLRWVPNSALEVNVTGDYTQDNSEAAAMTLLYAAPVTGALNKTNSINGVTLGNTTGSPFISYSPFGAYAQDTASHSPYSTYATFCDTSPSDGSLPYCDPAQSHVESGGVSSVVDYRVSDQLSLKSITAYRTLSADWSVEESGSPISGLLTRDQVNENQFSEELRASGDVFANLLNYTVGAFYFTSHSRFWARNDFPAFEFIQDDSAPLTTKAVFTNLDWHFTDQFELSTGVRYTRQQREFDYGRGGVPGIAATTFPPGPVNGAVAPYLPCPNAGGEIVSVTQCGLNGTAASFTNDHVDYRVAPQYQWTSNFMTYASVSTGFKGGGSNPRPFTVEQEQSFSPETIRAYEIGAKSEWLEHRLRFNAAAFYNNYDDIQLNVLSCPQFGPAPGCAATVNAGNANIKGVELESEFHPLDALRIDATASYLDFKFKTLSANAVGSGVTPDMTSPYAPKYKYNLGIQYAISIANVGAITPRLDVSHQATEYDAVPNNYFSQIRGYTLLNGGLTWRETNGKWQTTLQGTNIANKLYYLNTFSNLQGSGTVMGEPAPPREWSISVRRNF